MTVIREGEQNILGCAVRISSDGKGTEKASRALELLENQINNIRSTKPGLSNLDIAVLAALNLSLERIDLENEYKGSVLSLKEELSEVIEFVGSQSPAIN